MESLFGIFTEESYNCTNSRNLKGNKTQKLKKLLFNYFFYIGFFLFILAIPLLSAYVIWNFIRINALDVELKKLQIRFQTLEKHCEVTQQHLYEDIIRELLSNLSNRKQEVTLNQTAKVNQFLNNPGDKSSNNFNQKSYNLLREITSAPEDLQLNTNLYESRRTEHRKGKRSVSRTTIIGDVVYEPKDHNLRELTGESVVNHGRIGKTIGHYSNPAAHFHLNSKYTSGKHAKHQINSYGGDIYIGSASWTNQININSYFHLENGLLTVAESGLYYVYAQICYNNTYNHNGFVVFHGQKPFLQCLSVVPTDLALKTHTCHTSGLIYLNANEHIHLRDLHSDRSVVLRELNNRSYFGLMRV